METYLRIGIVSSVDAETTTVRVYFPDLDDVVSDDLFVLQHGQEEPWLPAVNSAVLCLMCSEDVETDGYVLGEIK